MNHVLASVDNGDVAALVRALGEYSSDGKVRLAIARAAGSIGGSSALQLVRALASDDDARVRVTAIDALKRIGPSPEASEVIETVLKRDSAGWVRLAAAEAAGCLWAREHATIADSDQQRESVARAEQALMAALHDGDWAVRSAAADALGGMRSRAAVDRLVQLLDDRHRLVRWNAGGALVRIGDPRAIEYLSAAARRTRSPVWKRMLRVGARTIREQRRIAGRADGNGP